MSAEPSMEDILSSIKRIISEEAEPAAARPRRAAPAERSAPLRQMATPVEEGDREVLELSDPMPEPAAEPRQAPPPAARSAAPAGETEAGISARTVEATRGALDVLSRMIVRPEPESDGTLEGLVREMLRPMLREWIDAHLPAIVETMVAREIARITGAAN